MAETAQAGFPKLDSREEHFQIPSHRMGLSLFLRYLPASREPERRSKVVLYVHGGTFSSGLSIATASMEFPGATNWRHPGFTAGDWISTASVASPIRIRKCRSRPR